MSMCALKVSSTKVSGWLISNAGYLTSVVSPTRANYWEAKGKAFSEGSMADMKYMVIFRKLKKKRSTTSVKRENNKNFSILKKLL